MQGSDQQAYDRGTTIFSPDGRLYQVEYAREAVKQGAPVVGIRAGESVVLVAHGDRRSPLVEARSVEKLFAVDGHIGIASAGHAADTRRLIDLARRTAQSERLRYGEAATVESLARATADHVQEYTQSGGTRPYGTALLVAGYDEAPRLFEIDPSGATSEWRAAAVGRDAGDIVDHLEGEYEPDLAVDDALNLAVLGLGEALEKLRTADATAGVVDQTGFEVVSEDRLQGIIEDNT